MTHRGHDPRAVVNQMIEFALEQEVHLPNVSVQKLLYFAHAAHLAKYGGTPLVASVFEAWEYGPVCRPIYDELKHYGRSSVSQKIEDIDLFTGEVTIPSLPNDLRVKSHVFNIMDSLGRLSPGQLIDLSHVKGGAWHETWHKARTRTTVGGAICDSLIRERFYLLKMPIKPSIFGDPDEAAPLTGT